MLDSQLLFHQSNYLTGEDTALKLLEVAKPIHIELYFYSFKHIFRVKDMISENPLHEWRFLIGTWKGESKGQFGMTGELSVKATFTFELEERTIVGKTTTTQDAKVVNQSISFMFYDVLEETFRRKTLFSYGWVNNEVAYKGNANEIHFDVISEPLPKQFEGIQWRSYIIKVSPTKILMGLEEAKKGGDFKLYGETELTKIG